MAKYLNTQQHNFKSSSRTCESLYERDLRGLPISPSHHISNSNVRNQSKELNYTNSMNFTYTVPSTTQASQIKIPYLSKRGEQPLGLWIDLFNKATRKCTWDETTQLAILDELLIDDMEYLVKSKRTVNSILDTLLQLEYPPTDRRKYLKDLSLIRQENYRTITEYVNTINDVVQKL